MERSTRENDSFTAVAYITHENLAVRKNHGRDAYAKSGIQSPRLKQNMR